MFSRSIFWTWNLWGLRRHVCEGAPFFIRLRGYLTCLLFLFVLYRVKLLVLASDLRDGFGLHCTLHRCPAAASLLQNSDKHSEFVQRVQQVFNEFHRCPTCTAGVQRSPASTVGVQEKQKGPWALGPIWVFL